MQSQSQSAHKDDEYWAEIKRLVDSWPALTEDQRGALRLIFAPSLAASARSRARWAKVTDRAAATQKARDALAAKRAAKRAAESARDSGGVGDAA